MNYYPFHLGDYAAHTGHLEPMEDLAYRRLLDQYYLRECPLPADIEATAKLVRMRSMKSDVESVLREFFVLAEDGWRHARCDAEIEKMQDKQAKARASGIASANARKSYAERARQAKPTDVEAKPADVERSLSESSTDAQLPTPTPTPTPIKEPSGSLLAAKRRKQIPPDFAPNEAGLEFAKSRGLCIADELQKFSDHHAAKGSVMLDWQAAWRTWASNAKTFARPATVANKQIAIEQRNKAVADEWLRAEGFAA